MRSPCDLVTCTSSVRHIATRAAATPLELLPAGDLGDHEVTEFFDYSIGRVADHVRTRLETAGTADPSSQDLLAGIAEELDGQVRMLRGKSILKWTRLAVIRRRSPRPRGSPAA